MPGALRIGVLGPLKVTVNGRDVALGGPRQRAVLAVLVAARGHMVPQETLIFRAWDERRTPSPTTLHSYVLALRKALEPSRPHRQSARVLVRENTGYALRVGAEAVDSEQFTALAARGEELLRGDDPDGAATVLSEAIGLWRGDAYAEFAEYSFAAPEAARLNGLRLSAQENLFAAQLARGRHAAIVGDLEKHTAEAPLSERGWELLALALYRSGRQGDALAVLRTARRLLAEELGIDPGPALRELETALLVQDDPDAPPQAPGGWDLLGRPPDAVDPPAVPQDPRARTHGPRRNLPFALTGLVGRQEAFEQAKSLVAAHRLVTLTGPGGIGKTRLMLEVAHARDDEDGPWLVELADLEKSNPRLLSATITAVLGVRDASDADDLADVLAEREMLLVLDNCEHLRNPVANTVARLLLRCRGLRVLVTSREPLGVMGEVIYEVPPLSAEAGRDLFLTRASATAPGWLPDDSERSAAERICTELDGLPLAIELAAAQCRTLSVEQVSQALRDRFSVLVAAPGPGPTRHQALRATVEWSYRLLLPREREVFHRLSVFAGSFDLEAATAVCGGSVLTELTALVRKSLVTAEPGTSPRRYRLLETLKEFGRQRAGTAELATVQAQHRAWVLTRITAAAELMESRNAVHATRQTARDLAEIRAAFTSALLAGDGPYALRLGGALTRFWYRSGHGTEGLGWLNAALETSPDGPPGPRARALVAVSSLSYLKGDFDNAAWAAAEAARAAGDAGDVVTQAQALSYRALFEGMAGAPGAVRQAEAAWELARSVQLPWLEAESAMIAGMLLRMAGQTQRARDTLRYSAALAGDCGHRFVQASSSWLMMKIDLHLGRAERALATGIAILRDLEEDQDLTAWLAIAHTTAAALALCGHPEGAARLLGVVDEQGSRIGFTPHAMDPVDSAWQNEQVRSSMSPQAFTQRLEEGRKSTARIDELLSATGIALRDQGGAGNSAG
ncbi:AfsR/SARP family transcriptional regulator [Streptomyces sp. WSLK1-3]|uniref:AfsR/SARP family transcriptional regulator n=1 Tax=Streptomyces sp. WSLK1-3 TaxID=3375475 RepID=UPI0037A95FB1